MRLVAYAILACFLFLFVFWGIGTFSCDQPPKQNSETQQATNSEHNNCSTPYGTLITGLHDTGRFVDSFHDQINAFSTLVIAIFTIVLGVFTVSVAKSTRDAANAAVDADRPRVFCDIEFDRLGGDISNVESVPLIRTTFKNVGRTAAIVRDLRIIIEVRNTLPKKPDYGPARIFFQKRLIILPDKEWSAPAQPFAEFNPAKHNARGDRAALVFNGHLWVYGYISYLDHTGRTRKHGFAGWWPPIGVGSPVGESGKSFVLTENKNYTYDT